MYQLEDNLGVGTLVCGFHARTVDVALRPRASLGQACPAAEHLREQLFLPIGNDGDRLLRWLDQRRTILGQLDGELVRRGWIDGRDRRFLGARDTRGPGDNEYA